MNQWTTIDKSTWGDGPWQTEPDKISWTDEATGLPCLIVRARSGALCGYVGVDETHPLHGFGYDVDVLADVHVHGGLTFSDSCHPGEDESTGICHVPEPGASDHVWWFGFDTNHGFDYPPAMVVHMRRYLPPELVEAAYMWGTYKTVAYVRGEVEHLAAQLAWPRP